MPNICLMTGCVDDGTLSRAGSLSAAGHSVTVLNLSASPQSVASVSQTGVRLVPCPAADTPVVAQPLVSRAYDAWQWSQARDFDVVGYTDVGGAGYFVALARRLGLGFARTALVAFCEGPTLWRLARNERLPGASDLAADHLERTSVAGADVAVAPSRVVVDWMRAEGWTVPSRTHVAIPDLAASSATGPPHPRIAPAPVHQLVFVGPLERGSGLVTFVHALGRLTPTALARTRSVLLGSVPDRDDAWKPLDWLVGAMPAGLSWSIADADSMSQALALVDGAGCLLVLPAATARLPAWVKACLDRGLGFVACATDETRELVHPDDWSDVLCGSDPPALAEALSRAIVLGLRSARPGDVAGASDDAWLGAIAEALGERSAAIGRGRRSSRPSVREVSVVITHRNRPRLLRQALEGLRQQTVQGFDVVLVDDGSDVREALDTLESIEPEFASRGWQVLRQPNRYLGAARNAGWRAARGRYVLFHDDDNVAMPHQIERLLDAVWHTDAAIVTSAFEVFRGMEAPGVPSGPRELRVFLGGAVGFGLFENCFGDAQALVRRDVLASMGGFTEDFGIGHEDWEFFARATLSGAELVSVPEPLFWYRVGLDSMLRRRPDLESDLRRNARAYTERLPPALRPALLAALGCAMRGEDMLRSLTEEQHQRTQADAARAACAVRLDAAQDQLLEARQAQAALEAHLAAEQRAATARLDALAGAVVEAVEARAAAQARADGLGQRLAVAERALADCHAERAGLAEELRTLAAALRGAADAVAASRSMRVTKAVRALVESAGRHPSEDQFPDIAPTAAAQLDRLLGLVGSPSWEVTSPLRLLARALRRR